MLMTKRDEIVQGVDDGVTALANINEAREILGGISDSTIRRIVLDGELAIVRIRGRVFYKKEDLAELIERGNSRPSNGQAAA